MGRPKKLESEIMVQIVDSFFTTEAAGNPSMLKFSTIEQYAGRMGYEVKAYDFKRDQTVRDRIAELKDLSGGKNELGLVQGIAYKSLDVAGVISSCKSEKELIAALTEMDKSWKNTYESCVKYRKKCEKEMSSHRQLKEELTSKKQALDKAETDLCDLRRKNRDLMAENRYLKRMLKTYLYPAVADLILEEGLGKQRDSLVDESHIKGILDGRTPSSVSESTKNDRESITEIEQILLKMKKEME